MRNIGKYKVERRIDRKARAPFVSSADTGDGGGVLAPPAPPVVPAPTNLVLSTALSFSAITPGAKVIATWRNLEAYDLETYQVQIDTASTFATAETYRTAPNQASITIDNRRTNTLYYVRVRTVVQDTPSAWTAAATVTTPQDTTPPAAPTSQAAAFINGGDLIVTWTEPTSANLKDVEVKIYDSASKTVLYATAYSATGRYVWTAAQNRAAGSGTADPSLYAELRSRSWGNVFSTAVNASATKAAPAAPVGLVHSWASDTGSAGGDWALAWTAAADAALWQLTINGVARTVAGSSYTYTLDTNIAQNASADPTLSYSLVAVDALGQVSSATAGTATNAAPPTTALTAVGSVNAIAVTITPTTAADFAYYSLRIVKDGATQATVTTRATTALLDVGPYGSGTYQIGVTVVDAFGQASTETLSTGGFLEPFTLTTFRSGARYRDSLGSSSTALDSLKDTVLTSGGVSYS